MENAQLLSVARYQVPQDYITADAIGGLPAFSNQLIFIRNRSNLDGKLALGIGQYLSTGGDTISAKCLNLCLIQRESRTLP